LQTVNQKLLSQLQPEQVEVVVEQFKADMKETAVEESELDAPVDYVGKKTNPGGGRHAIDIRAVIGLCIWAAEGSSFLSIWRNTRTVWNGKYCADGWGAYERHLPVENHEVG